MAQHYFIGFKIPEREANRLANARDKWDLDKNYKAIPDVRDLHITLQYLGGVEPGIFNELSTKLLGLDESLPGFRLTLRGVSTFGNPNKPRVIYTSVDEEPALIQLQKKIKDIVQTLPLKVDQKPFVPHITLAKKWIGQDLIDLEGMEIEPMETVIGHFSIFAIHPQKVPSYEAVKTINLKEI